MCGDLLLYSFAIVLVIWRDGVTCASVSVVLCTRGDEFYYATFCFGAMV